MYFQFYKSLRWVTVDQFLLGVAYLTAINDQPTQVVSVVGKGESFEDGTAKLLGYATVQELEQFPGGGKNVSTGVNSTLSVVMSNSKQQIDDYMSSAGNYVSRKRSLGELMAHEVLGHGFNRTGGGSLTDSHKDPIQMTNLYLRSQNTQDVYRDGRYHGSAIDVNLTKQQATGIPEAISERSKRINIDEIFQITSMLKFFLFLIVCNIFISLTWGQEKLGCKCAYKSRYEINKYLSDTDSLYKALKGLAYKNVIVIGARGINAATLMFIVKVHGRNKAFFYDLIERKKRIHQGRKLDSWVEDIVNDSSFLYTAKSNPDYASHDFSYFISFNYPKRGFTELCHSALSRDSENRFSRALVYFLSGFK